jgi:type II secretion system protein G
MHTTSRGFTLIELLVVVAIIGVLSSVVLASVNDSRAKARDSRRTADLNQIERALELYYLEFKQYPNYNANTAADTCGTNWCLLETDLAPYIAELPRDPTRGDTWRYYYDSDTGDRNQTYGLMARFEDPANFPRADNDGGFYQGSDCCYYEVGVQPSYCIATYGLSGNWWAGGTNVCSAGN